MFRAKCNQQLTSFQVVLQPFEYRIGSIVTAKRLYDVADPTGLLPVIFQLSRIYHPYVLRAATWKACHSNLRKLHGKCEDCFKLRTHEYEAATRTAMLAVRAIVDDSNPLDDEASDSSNDDDDDDDDCEDEEEHNSEDFEGSEEED